MNVFKVKLLLLAYKWYGGMRRCHNAEHKTENEYHSSFMARYVSRYTEIVLPIFR